MSLDSSPKKSEFRFKLDGRWTVSSCLCSSRFSPLVPDDGVVRRVDHCGVVYCGEISVHQVEVVHAQ